jgi:hypothetical protein
MHITAVEENTMKRRVFTPEVDYQQRAHDTQQGSCTRKDTYANEASAKVSADRVSKRDGTLVTWYKCRFCDGYHLTKASNATGGAAALELSGEWKGNVVRFDARGPYIDAKVTCIECHQSEPGKQRLSVVDGLYTRCQAIELDNKESMAQIKKGSKHRKHKVCPALVGPPAPEAGLEEFEVVEGFVGPPAPEITPDAIEGIKSISSVDFAVMDGNVILDLYGMLDPKNTHVSDAFARGAAWLLVRQIVEELSKA